VTPRCPVSRRKALKRKVASANEPKGNHSNNEYLLSTFVDTFLFEPLRVKRRRQGLGGSPVFFALKEDGKGGG